MLYCSKGHDVKAGWKVCPECSEDLVANPPKPKVIDVQKVIEDALAPLKKQIEALTLEVARLNTELGKKADRTHSHTDFAADVHNHDALTNALEELRQKVQELAPVAKVTKWLKTH